MVGQNFKRLLTVAVWMVCCLTGFAQYSVNFVNSVVTVIDGNTHPSGIIYDNGGPNGKYSNNFAGMVRIEADMGDTIVVWGHVKTEGACDQLFVYEGEGREGLIGAFCKDTSFALQSTSGYASLWFNTDRSIVDSGLVIHYEIRFNSCTNNVMEFEATDIASTSVHLQWASPDTNGPFLLSIDGRDTIVTQCHCDVIGLLSDTNYTFTVVSLADTANIYCPRFCTIHTPCFIAGISGVRPLIGSRDNIVLVADSADGYIWNTGDTTRELYVTQPGEYYVVAVTAGGCSDTAYARVIRIGLVLDINVPSCLCSGDQADINVGFDRDASIRIIPGSAVLSVANEIFLPDGIYCDPYGCSYRSEQTFSGFPPGARIEDVNDIKYVMLKIEHSWLGDLYMNITCPNGQSANILRYGGVGTSACNSSITDDCRGWDPGNNASLGSYLGSALDSGDTRYPCDSLVPLNRPGQGWRYCWSNATDAGYQYAPGDGRLYRAWNMVHSSIDSSDVLRHRQFYHPDESFSNLVGCPMNGTWYIEVIDGWSEDNGYIFGWELALDSNRLMRNSYYPTLHHCELEGPWYQQLTDTTFSITAPRDLTRDTLVKYLLHIYDSNEHVFDTFFYVQFRAAAFDTIFDTITENDLPYTYNDSIFTNDTTNYVFHRQRIGDCHCDSIITYNLFVKRSSTFSAETAICSNKLPFTWYEYTFDSAYTLRDTIPNHWRLDSVITLTLRLLPTFVDTLFQSICSYEHFEWDDTTYSSTGFYNLFTLASQDGCDSSLYLDLLIQPQEYFDTFLTACDSISFAGRSYLHSLIDTIPNVSVDSNGCQVSDVLHLTIKHSSVSDQSAHVCDTFPWFDTIYHAPLDSLLTHIFPGANASGCDSTVRLSLVINASDTISLFDTICQNVWLADYSHHDSLDLVPTIIFPFDTILLNHTTTPDGCYRLEQTYLHVKANTDSIIFDTIVENYANTWSFHGFPLHCDTVITFDTFNVAGCDSIIRYNLHVIPNVHDTVRLTICENDTLRWNGLVIPLDTNTFVIFPSSAGSDSIVHLIVTYKELQYTVIDTAICATDTYLFHDNILSLAGSYVDTLHTVTLPSCDSIVRLNLAVLDTSVADTVVVVCDSFEWCNRHYYTSLIDSLILATPNHNGCDSMLRLHLSVRYSDTTNLFDTICQNVWLTDYNHHDSFDLVPINIYPFDTILLNYTTTPDGCYRLERTHLHVNANTDSVIFDTIVENDADAWSFRGVPLHCDTVLTFDTFNVSGCDSIIRYNLHVIPNVHDTVSYTICESDTLRWNELVIPPDTNSFVVFPSSAGSDSIVHLILTVKPLPDTFLSKTIFLGDSLVFDDTILRVPGLYHFIHESLSDCDTLVTLRLNALIHIYDTIYDTICQGDSILFARCYRSHPGIYFDTIPVASDSSITSDTSFLVIIDTIRVLSLTLIPQHPLHLDIQTFCNPDNPHYAIHAHTSAQYLQWAANPSDANLLDHENDSSIFVAPPLPTTYYIFADYSDTPLCPVSDSVALSPVPLVTADIVTTPDIITFNDRELIAFNSDDANVIHHAWTTWYDSDPPIFDSIDTLTLQVPITANNVRISLLVNNQFCADTDTVIVKVFNSTIFFPNVFTPNLDNNNRFFAQGVGIIQFEMWIYDRRGDLVFHSTSIDQKWDGTSQGRICPQAAYAYKCRYTTILTPRGWQTLTGTVTLLR